VIKQQREQEAEDELSDDRGPDDEDDRVQYDRREVRVAK
jgi:hypothetical protein